ncbi:hypothetical protein PUN28_002367 [Cardiocondyla obscurior]|uniref:Protein aurora borealis n=1 Tax=Cardiocondyla obscurior TaxID=286306 RepID=A0AAW2GTW8_9HYME
MEPAACGTPNEKQSGESPLARSPWMRGTPVKRNDFHLKRNDLHLKRLTYKTGQCLPFAVLPNHITPPSKLRKLIRNPFEPELISRLHLSAISPTVFAKVPSPMQQSPGFKWSIDELAQIKPARIEELSVQQPDSPDLELETKAQAAIDRFFKQNQIIPSPWDVKQKENKPLLPLDTPNRISNSMNSTQEISKSTKDAWSQTVLSLPQDLPANVEEALKPFFTFTQEQNIDNDDINSSNNSLRRKLIFCQNESDDESFTSLSPVKMNESMILPCSPPQSGFFVHGTPLKRLSYSRWQNNGSSVRISENISPPNMSPIQGTEKDKLYDKTGHCSTVTRLNFTVDMSIDDITERKDQSPVNGYHSLDMSNSEHDVKCTEDNGKLLFLNNGKTNIYDSMNMRKLPNCINSIDNIMQSNSIVFNDKKYNNEICLKISPNTTSFSREKHKQSNIMSGAFEHQRISNSIQDTGYQTCSMNSTTYTIDSYNISTNHKAIWNEKMMTKNNTQLSWKEDIQSVFSSTPSKSNKKGGI